MLAGFFNKFSYTTEGTETGEHMVCFSAGGKNAFPGTQKETWIDENILQIASISEELIMIFTAWNNKN